VDVEVDEVVRRLDIGAQGHPVDGSEVRRAGPLDSVGDGQEYVVFQPDGDGFTVSADRSSQIGGNLEDPEPIATDDVMRGAKAIAGVRHLALQLARRRGMRAPPGQQSLAP
jgi:hypothetical protein